jgi:hypothetical protein
MYKAILFAPDGDWTTDHKADTVEEVWNLISDQGSKWYFYPYPFVIRDNGALTSNTQRIVDVPDFPVLFDELKNRSIKSASRFIASLGEEDHFAILG